MFGYNESMQRRATCYREGLLALAITSNLQPMTDETMTETGAENASRRTGIDIPWTRLEGVLAGGALLTSFVWFLGMPTGMAFGVGFGIVLLVDFARAVIFGSSRVDREPLSRHELARH